MVKVPAYEGMDTYGEQGRVFVIVPPYCKVTFTYRAWGGRVRTKKMVFRLDEVRPIK